MNVKKLLVFLPGVPISRATKCCALQPGIYLWGLSMELALCHRPSGAQSFEVAPRFLENFWTPNLAYTWLLFLRKRFFIVRNVSNKCAKWLPSVWIHILACFAFKCAAQLELLAYLYVLQNLSVTK